MTHFAHEKNVAAYRGHVLLFSRRSKIPGGYRRRRRSPSNPIPAIPSSEKLAGSGTVTSLTVIRASGLAGPDPMVVPAAVFVPKKLERSGP